MISFFQIHQLEIKINFYGNKNIILIHIYHLRTIDQERIKEHEKRKEREEEKKEKWKEMPDFDFDEIWFDAIN